MAERDIILNDLTKQRDLFQLKDYLRELFSLFSPRLQTVTFGATITVDADQAETFFITLTDNITGITIKNADTGRKIKFIFLQGGAGSYTIAGWPATILLAGASFIPTTNVGRYSTVSFEYVNLKWVEIARTTDVR